MEIPTDIGAILVACLGGSLMWFSAKFNHTTQIPQAPSSLPNRISHDLRTALNAVIGGIHLLKNSPEQRIRGLQIENLSISAAILEAVALDLLETTPGIDSNQVLQPAQVDISHLCGILARTLRETASERGIKIDVSVSPALPSEGFIDRIRLIQLIQRLGSSVIEVLSTPNTSLSLSFEKITSSHKATQQAIACSFSVTSPSLHNVKNQLIELGNPPNNSRLASLLTLLNAHLQFEYNSNNQLVKFDIELPFGTAPSSNFESASMIDGEVLVVSDDTRLATLVEQQLKILGVTRYAMVGTHEYLSNQMQEFCPDTIIAIIDPAILGQSDIIKALTKPTSSRVIPIIDSLDEDALKCWGASADIQPLLYPFGIGDLKNFLLRPRRSASTIGVQSTGQRILVVDDVRVNRLVLTKHLEVVGHEVVTANNGDEAIKLLEAAGHFSEHEATFLKFGYDMVIMDIDMPVLGGLAATEKIREMENLLACSGVHRHVPIIAATADAVGNDYERFILAGMEWFITKPIDPNRLFQLVGHFTEIGPRRSRRAPSRGSAIDLSWLRGQFAGDEDTVFEVVEAFLDEIDSLWLALFKVSIGASNEDIRWRAHALKGSLQNVGAHAAAEIAKRVESEAKSENSEQARELIDVLASEIKAAKECAVALRSQRVLNVTSSLQQFS
jgi:CheY-like chemotaxis protein